MAEGILDSARKVKNALSYQGALNLWEVRAILGEDRDHVSRVLNLLSAQSTISFIRTDDQLRVALR
jgi:hypothetical protein